MERQEAALVNKDLLEGYMADRLPLYQEARMQRDRSGGVSAERNAVFRREAEAMDALLDAYLDLGCLALEAA